MKRVQSLRLVERPTSFPVKTVLLVDERDDSRVCLKWFLTNSDYVVDTVRNAEEALTVFQPVIHDLVVTGNAMSGISGVELAHIIKLRSPRTPVVMYTDQPPSDCSCLDLVIESSIHMLALKIGMDQILAEG